VTNIIFVRLNKSVCEFRQYFREFDSWLCVRRRRESPDRVSSTMDSLRLVEERVGAVQSWPTYIMLRVFMDEPNARTVKKFAAFMYGNELPVDHAVNCFHACNGLNRSCVSEKCTCGTKCGRLIRTGLIWQNTTIRA
jgi:hypothetical protein